MDYSGLGQRITELRTGAGIAKQSDLARLLSVKQQTVSRWEAGTSRPRLNEIDKLAQCIGADVEELRLLAKYSASTLTVTFDQPFPLDALTPASFERFSVYFIESFLPEATVNPWGSSGHKQHGIDLIARFPNGETCSFQCKRVQQFGPKDVLTAIGEHTVQAEKKIILLSRVASPAARLSLQNRTDWEIWDVEDVSRKIRELPIDTQKRIVRIFFRGQELALLGHPAESPWQSPEEFYEPFASETSLFNHSWKLIGRTESLDKLVGALTNDNVKLILLTGAGGSGKSKLLREAISEVKKQNAKSRFIFLSTTGELTKQSCDELGKHEQTLVVDDAHDRENLLPLFEYDSLNRTKTKILLSMRRYGIDRIRRQAAGHSLVVENDNLIDLKTFSKQDSESLALLVLEKFGGDKTFAKNIAEFTYECPLATVVAARLVAEKNIYPIEVQNEDVFRQTLMSRFERVVAGHIGNKEDASNVQKVLGFVALVQPIAINDYQLAETFTKATQLPAHEFSRLIKNLIDAGVLFKRGPKYRLSPDLLGDHLIEARCVGTGGVSTGYAEEVYDLLPEGYVENLLLNLGRLDWRRTDCNTDESSLLDGVWAKLKPQSKYSDTALEAVAGVAYYQPRRALDFVERYLHEDDYRDQLSKIAKYASYNITHLERALGCLWTMGRHDSRQTNRYPDHPLRVIDSLAEPTRGKPIEFNSQVLDFAFSLLDDPSNWSDHASPLDIFDSVLKTESYTTSSEGHSVQFSGFSVSPSAVQKLRERVIDKCIALLESKDLAIAVRTTKSLREAIRSPMGMMGAGIGDTTRKAWQSEFSITMKKMLVAAQSGKLDSSVQVELGKAVSWHAQYGVGETNELAKKIQSSLSDSLEFKVSRVLSDGWGMEDRRAHRDDFEVYWRNKMTKLVQETRKTFGSGTDQLTFIEERLIKIKDGKNANSSSPHIFITLLAELSPEFADAVIDSAFENAESITLRFAGTALGFVFSSDRQKGRNLFQKFDETGREDLQREIGNAYSMQRFESNWFDDIDRKLLVSLLSSEQIFVVGASVNALRQIVKWNKKLALELVLETNVITDRIADELATLFEFGDPIPYFELRAEDVAIFLNKLEHLPELDGHWLEKLIASLSELHPQIVANFLMKRVELVETKGSGYRPCNYGPWRHEAMRFRKTSAGMRLMKDVAEWMKAGKSRGWNFNYYARNLFNVMFGPVDAEFVRFFEEWLPVATEEDILAIGSILRESESNTFVFDQRKFVEALLERANQFGRKTVKLLSTELYCTSRSGVKSGTAGEPYPQDIQCRDKAIEVLKSLPRYSVAYELYDDLRKDAEYEIKRRDDDEG